MTKLADRVLETSASVGTGAFILSGAKTGYQAFSDAFEDGDLVHYCITDGTDWETGVGTFALGALTLTRTLVRKSTNANAAVVFAAGAKDVFCTATADAISRKRDLIILYRLGL
jgi:hypothetical protein